MGISQYHAAITQQCRNSSATTKTPTLSVVQKTCVQTGSDYPQVLGCCLQQCLSCRQLFAQKERKHKTSPRNNAQRQYNLNPIVDQQFHWILTKPISYHKVQCCSCRHLFGHFFERVLQKCCVAFRVASLVRVPRGC